MVETAAGFSGQGPGREDPSRVLFVSPLSLGSEKQRPGTAKPDAVARLHSSSTRLQFGPKCPLGLPVLFLLLLLFYFCRCGSSGRIAGAASTQWGGAPPEIASPSEGATEQILLCHTGGETEKFVLFKLPLLPSPVFHISVCV